MISRLRLPSSCHNGRSFAVPVAWLSSLDTQRISEWRFASRFSREGNARAHSDLHLRSGIKSSLIRCVESSPYRPTSTRLSSEVGTHQLRDHEVSVIDLRDGLRSKRLFRALQDFLLPAKRLHYFFELMQDFFPRQFVEVMCMPFLLGRNEFADATGVEQWHHMC